MRYQSHKPRRQFLAGVSCPKCKSMDTVVQVQVFQPTADEYIECTQCGHQERRPDANSVRQQNLGVNALQTSAKHQASKNGFPSVTEATTTNAGIQIISITE